MSFLKSYRKALKKGASFGVGAIGNPLGGLGLLGGGGDPGQKQLAQMLGAVDEAKRNTSIGTARSVATVKSAIPAVRAAYAKANANTGFMAEATKRRLGALEDPKNIRAQAGLDALGMGTSSLVPLASRGIRGDTARALAEVDRAFGDRLDQNAVGEATTTSSILGQAGQINQSGVNSMNDVIAQLLQVYGSQKFTRKKNLLDVLGAAAPIIGAVAGGPAGAAAGGMIGNATGNPNQYGGGSDFGYLGVN